MTAAPRRRPPPRVVELPSKAMLVETRADRVARWLSEMDELEKAADEACKAQDDASAECDRTHTKAMEAYEAFSRATEKYDDARAAALAAIEATDAHYKLKP